MHCHIINTHQTMSMKSIGNTASSKAMNSNTLFVGNLSFFCEESHLFQLFDQYGDVQQVHIIRNVVKSASSPSRPLFGFVTLKSDAQVADAIRILDNHFFMGRTLRLSRALQTRNASPTITGNQQLVPCNDVNKDIMFVRIRFTSYFDLKDQITRPIRPTESFLRKVLGGSDSCGIVDIDIKEYIVHPNKSLQEGYAIITVNSFDEACYLCSQCADITCHGITLNCSFSQL